MRFNMFFRIVYSIFIHVVLMFGLCTKVLAQNSFEPYDIQTIQAEDATEINGFLSQDTDKLAFVTSGDWFSIDTNDLGAGVDAIIMRYAKEDPSSVNVDIRRGSLTGPIISSGEIDVTGGLNRYSEVIYQVDRLKGENELFFIFDGGGSVGHIDQLVFAQAQKNVLYANRANESSGVAENQSSIIDIKTDDWLRFRNVRMGNGFSKFSVKYTKDDTQNNHLSLHLDSPDGPIIGEIDLIPTDGSTSIINGNFENVQGLSNIYAKFSGPGVIANFDYISLESQPLSTELAMADAKAILGMEYFDENKFLKLTPGTYHTFRFNYTNVSYNPKIQFSYAYDGDEPKRLQIRKNQYLDQVLARIELPSTGSLDNYETHTIEIDPNSQGNYNLVFRFLGPEDVNIGNIKLIRIDESDDIKPPLGETRLENIVVDQFGYRPKMQKVAILRDGQVGRGSLEADYIAGNQIALVDEDTHEIVYTRAPVSYRNGATDSSSGDRVWSFDFSEFDTAGSYYVYDADNNARSASFEINENIYDDVLKEAFRTFVYQRSGFDKTAQIVGENYVDAASHTGPLQDSAARLYNRPRNRLRERDLHGGWYDAGDFKKYSNWTADYILGLLDAYHANPEAWPDDWNLPESGNNVPDILDEVRWGVEHLQRMQETASETNASRAGSVLSVLDSDDSVSPASANVENSFYGPATTSATFTSAAAYAFAASTFETLPNQAYQNLAISLRNSAITAYQWAENNPNVRFNNSENGVGNGNSEITEDYFLDAKHRIAAIYLYGLTQEQSYKTFVETNYTNSRLMTTLWASPYEVEEPNALLHYSTLDGITPNVGTAIKNKFNETMEYAGNARPALDADPYRAYIQEYAWGSNKQKSRKGHMFAQLVTYDLGERPDQENLDVAAGYLHYLHGVNPLGKVYLSNMDALGAERSVDEIYHRWFADESPWDNVNNSFGPPPGFLVGGPNQYYNGSLEIDQPPMKSYVETNSYLNGEQSWQLTENSNGYQIEYLKLLSKFVD